MLHSRLDEERKLKGDARPQFIIEPETDAVTALSLTDFLRLFGVLWAVTGTLGGPSEILELSRRYQATMSLMPTHLKIFYRLKNQFLQKTRMIF
ncbi:MAG: hypothetical protein ACRCXC_06025 [Legionella sp.]